MRIGILQTGRSPDELRVKHGDYDDLFRRLLEGRGFEFHTYPVLDGVLPAAPDAAEGWLITGSKFGAYENHDWIPPLEDFLRQTYAQGVPIVGICFGHQILAQALGGKVGKHGGGWSVGPVTYRDAEDDGALTALAWHQDQVTALPPDAKVLAGNAFCPYGILGYGDRALTMQPHPEFTPEFLGDLIAARRDVLPRPVAEGAVAALALHPHLSGFGNRIARFLRGQRTAM